MKKAECFPKEITPRGIVLSDGASERFIDFDECAKNFAAENSLGSSRCVATRDITGLTFIFFTKPKAEISFKTHMIKRLFTGRSASKEFDELRKAIIRNGYTTYDLS